MGPLARYTAAVSQQYGIPLRQNLAVWEWDRGRGWVELRCSLPVAAGRKLILVPRAFVRRGTTVFAADRYYRHYVLPFLQNEHYEANSSLCRILKDGTVRPPAKKTLMARLPGTKPANVQETEKHPEILERFRADAPKDFTPIGHSDLGTSTGAGQPDFQGLLDAALAIPAGNDGATAYHRAVEALLSALLYPALTNPVIEQARHEGRKRIDIDYTNVANTGFFHWLHAVAGINCNKIPVECKNYTGDPKNPEFDQLSGRFSTLRGNVGILCFRTSADKAVLIKRARDAALDGRGFILPLDDEDLKALVAERVNNVDGEDFRLLHERYGEITN